MARRGETLVQGHEQERLFPCLESAKEGLEQQHPEPRAPPAGGTSIRLLEPTTLGRAQQSNPMTGEGNPRESGASSYPRGGSGWDLRQEAL